MIFHEFFQFYFIGSGILFKLKFVAKTDFIIATICMNYENHDVL